MLIVLMAFPIMMASFTAPLTYENRNDNRLLVHRRLVIASCAVLLIDIFFIVLLGAIINAFTPEVYQRTEVSDYSFSFNQLNRGTVIRIAQLMTFDINATLTATAIAIWRFPANSTQPANMRELVRKIAPYLLATTAITVIWSYAMHQHPHAVADASIALTIAAILIDYAVANRCFQRMHDDQDPRGNEPIPLPPEFYDRQARVAKIRAAHEAKRQRNPDRTQPRPKHQPQNG